MTLVKVQPSKSASNGSTTPPKVEPTELKSQMLKIPAVDNSSPLDDRVLKIQMLADIIEKRDKISSSLRKLQSINTSSEGREVTITIEDAKTEWETANSEAIKFCIENLITSHKQKLAELETQICW